VVKVLGVVCDRADGSRIDLCGGFLMPSVALPIERTGTGVVTLTLSAGERGVVVLNRAMLESIDRALDEVDSEGPAAGIVLASDSRVFVAGADLGEIMSLDDDMRELIMKEASTAVLRDHARRRGMRSLRECGLLSIYEGLTSVDEVLRETLGED